jgi:beta-lactamase regulating signal transducer with metallopeptidase domain
MLFSEFLVVYACVWLLLLLAWKIWLRSWARPGPDTLFALQLTPFTLAAFTVSAFSVPAFLRFEPRQTQEVFGAPVLVLGSLSFVLLGFAVWRAGRSILEIGRLTRDWERNTTTRRSSWHFDIVETPADAPPLVVAGLFHPTLYISSALARVLNQQELEGAIGHEIAHVRRRDNLKKLVLRLCCIPAPNPIEQQWLAALETTADSEAVCSRQQALDLASALVKAARLSTSSPDLAMTFTSAGSELLRLRVNRLLQWSGNSSPISGAYFAVLAGCLSATAALLWSLYPTLLPAVHRFSELLMR